MDRDRGEGEGRLRGGGDDARPLLEEAQYWPSWFWVSIVPAALFDWPWDQTQSRTPRWDRVVYSLLTPRICMQRGGPGANSGAKAC